MGNQYASTGFLDCLYWSDIMLGWSKLNNGLRNHGFLDRRCSTLPNIVQARVQDKREWGSVRQ